MTRSGTIVTITGGGARPWSLHYGHYGTLDPPPASGVTIALASADGRTFFAHSLWLREIDSATGTVVGRWRFPCLIADVTPAAGRVHVRLNCSDGSRQSTTEWDFDPRDPQVPPGTWGGLLALRLPETEASYLLRSVGRCTSRAPFHSFTRRSTTCGRQ